MNQVQLVGRLSRSPELRYTGTGKAMTFITVAVDGYFDKGKGDTVTDFIDVKIWGKTAENVAKYCVKGSLISVVGRLSSSTFEKEGKPVFKLEVVADEVKFLSKPKSAMGAKVIGDSR